jgi:hypothetical protein
LQKTSPAQLVASTLSRTLSDDVTTYTFVDFCAGAGGPTPFIERDLNAQLSQAGNNDGAVKFVLTDIHPHIPDWTKASKKSENLSFVADSVDAANAPSDLAGQDGKKIFRLYNLAFHHFDDKLGSAILKNTIETADGFGYVKAWLRYDCMLTMRQNIRIARTNSFVFAYGLCYGPAHVPYHPFLLLEVAWTSLLYLHNTHHTICSGV